MIDYSHLNSLTDLLGKKVINQIRLDYEEDCKQKMKSLEEAWNEKNYEQLQQVSHSLKSASLNMAMQFFAEKCQFIENAASQKNEQRIANMIDTLPDIHQRSLKELQAYFVD